VTALDVAYRDDQLAVRARALRRLVRAWPVLDITALSATVDRFAGAAALLLLGFAAEAGEGTVGYLGAARRAARVAGAAPFQPAPLPDAGEVAGLVRGAALSGIVNARRRGADERRAMANGLVKTLAQGGKTVLDAGRATLLGGVEDDPRARGWERIASPAACDFCLDLSGRGPVYKAEATADFAAHGGCGCTARVVY
jgi:hypothetical protein